MPRPFFITGGTLKLDVPCYVSRRADAELLDALEAGEFCYVLTARQMGKSSLMVRTAARLAQSGHRTAVVDLTALGYGLTQEQFYLGVLTLTAEGWGTHSDEAWEANASLGLVQRFTGALIEMVRAAPNTAHVLFLDEIDAVRNYPFRTDELFAAIRELYNRRALEPDLARLTFCILGVASPSDLSYDSANTPFNIGRRIELTDFTTDEASVLRAGLGAAANPASAQRTLDRILHWTGGHPYLTQRLAAAVVEGGKAMTPAAVDSCCARLFFGHAAWDRDSNLAFVRERVLRALRPEVPPDEVRLNILERYDRALAGRPAPDDPGDPYCGMLRLSGIVRSERGRLSPRNRIYAHVFNRRWVTEHLPGAELRRQAAAFKRGVVRTSLGAGIMVLGMGAVTTWAIVNANQAERTTADLRRIIAREATLTHERDDAIRDAAQAEAKTEVDTQRLRAEIQRLTSETARLRKSLAQATAQREQLLWSSEDGNREHTMTSYWPNVINAGNLIRVTRVNTRDPLTIRYRLPNGQIRLFQSPAGNHATNLLLNGEDVQITSLHGGRPLELYGVMVDGKDWQPKERRPIPEEFRQALGLPPKEPLDLPLTGTKLWERADFNPAGKIIDYTYEEAWDPREHVLITRVEVGAPCDLTIPVQDGDLTVRLTPGVNRLNIITNSQAMSYAFEPPTGSRTYFRFFGDQMGRAPLSRPDQAIIDVEASELRLKDGTVQWRRHTGAWNSIPVSQYVTALPHKSGFTLRHWSR